MVIINHNLSTIYIYIPHSKGFTSIHRQWCVHSHEPINVSICALGACTSGSAPVTQWPSAPGSRPDEHGDVLEWWLQHTTFLARPRDHDWSSRQGCPTTPVCWVCLFLWPMTTIYGRLIGKNTRTIKFRSTQFSKKPISQIVPTWCWSIAPFGDIWVVSGNGASPK